MAPSPKNSPDEYEMQEYRSPLKENWIRFRRNRSAILGLLVICLLIITAIFAPFLAPYDPAAQNILNRLQPPSRAHLLGTDEYGRDILSRMIFGSRISLVVGFAAVGILVVLGITIGSLAGYSKKLDGPLMRFVDILLAVPTFFLLLAIIAMFGPGLGNTVLVIGLTNWMSTARLIRGEFLSLREKEFVEAARALGGRHRDIIFRHLLPNCIAVLIVQATLYISYTILLETSLSYLGLGAQPPTPSWGNMLAAGRNVMRDAWWVTAFPGLAIFFVVISFNFLGDGLRDAFDPHLRN